MFCCPPLTLEPSPVALLPIPPQTDAALPLISLLVPATNPPKDV
jgi:hypothetical protein